PFWARVEEAPSGVPKPLRRPTLPFHLPSWVLSRPLVWLHNELRFRAHVPRRRRGILHPEAFFYPLDAIGHWNRLYGRRGFTQYQCVLPAEAGPGAPRRLLEVLAASGRASMLCVIKDCGPEGLGILSFPRPGTSLAIDLPIRDDTQEVVDALNEQLIREGGRVYLAKDQFTRAEHLRRMEPRLDEWLAVRRKWDPQGRLRSSQSVRLLGDPA
ncbi:MAG: FAD-binding oxidoreductase, partial [Thermoanaerobaculia bacterium]|nr:FAD-binding oxidoreductase [Thermoanaerobaculia bacterium]